MSAPILGGPLADHAADSRPEQWVMAATWLASSWGSALAWAEDPTVSPDLLRAEIRRLAAEAAEAVPQLADLIHRAEGVSGDG